MKFFCKTLFLTLLVAFSLTACTEDPEDAVGTITGYVTKAPSGTEPVAGVTVSILSTGQSTTTGSNGAFLFTDMQPGTYSLQFTKTGYTTNTRMVHVVAGEENHCDVQLTPVNETAEIVINPSSLNFGTTQTDMSVTIKNNGNATAEWSLDLGNNYWLSASQLSGSIQAGRTQSITFSVDRNYLAEVRSVIVNLHAFGNSYPISVSCAPRNSVSEMTISPTELNFGSNLTEQTFTIRNTGRAALNWTVSGLTSPALTLSATQGMVSGGGSSTVIVTLDRSKVQGALTTTMIISDGIKEELITITANTSGGNTDPDNPDNPDNPQDIVVSSGLYAYFPFNGNFDDLSGNDIYGYGSPEPSFTTGLTTGTKALSFSRTTKSSFIVSQGLIDTQAMTVTFWAKNISGNGKIFHVTSSLNMYGGIMMTFASLNGHLKYVNSQYENTYRYDITGNFSHKTIDDNKWHHIALVTDYNKTNSGKVTALLYIDGKLMDTLTIGGESVEYGTGTKFILGGEEVIQNLQLANLRVYDSRQLSASEINEIYNAQQ